jgi:hypothetical protein
MLRGVSGFSVFTSRDSDFGSSANRNHKFLINANVTLCQQTVTFLGFL